MEINSPNSVKLGTEKQAFSMDALTNASVALLTIYEICKVVDWEMTISGVRLIVKAGGKSGHFVNRG